MSNPQPVLFADQHSTPAGPVVALVVGPDVDPVVKARVEHAMRTVADALGLRMSDQNTGPDNTDRNHVDISVGYGADADVRIEPGLVQRPAQVEAPQPVMIEGATGRLPAFHPANDGSLDYLAEVFEWISGWHELSVVERDDVGRIPSGSSLPIHAGLDPTVAWASRIINEFGMQLVAARPELKEWMDGRVAVTQIAASHDLDFFCRNSGDVPRRLGRSVLAAARRRDIKTITRTARMFLQAPHRIAQRLDTVAEVVALDQANGVAATWVVIARRAHRRDANYELEDLTELLVELDEVSDLAVHGSYTSLEAPGRLAAEYEALRAAGYEVTGGRQHWLRYRNGDLFQELIAAGATWDSSAAYSDRVGFRHGMASPYLLWDPIAERPLPLLQIPLVMMDMALDAMLRAGQAWEDDAHKVLGELERSPGTACSVLWHDTVFSGVQTDPAIVDLYRDLISRPFQWRSLPAIASDRPLQTVHR